MMKAATHIAPAAWMIAAETRAVTDILSPRGAEAQALFVGGCVRNLMLAQEPGDIDIATRHQPDAVIALLNAAGIRTVPTGIAHGTVTALSGGKSFEITTLRRDVRTDGRHAEVAFTDDWQEDAARRDFTINTLLADPEGNIYDPTGHGLCDLAARRVAFVGDPARRIAEDRLRILRFFRFHALYGAGEPDGPALAACRAEADSVFTLSRERITQEFLKILRADTVTATLALMFGNGVLRAVARPGFDPGVMIRLAGLQGGAARDAVSLAARLAALGGGDPAFFDPVLVLSNAQKKTVRDIVAARGDSGGGDAQAARRLVYFYGSAIALQGLFLGAAEEARAADPAGVQTARTWVAPPLPVSGGDVLACGVAAGPRVAALLSQTEQWWIAQDFTPDREACLARLKRFAE